MFEIELVQQVPGRKICKEGSTKRTTLNDKWNKTSLGEKLANMSDKMTYTDSSY